MEELFDKEKLNVSFGGERPVSYDHEKNGKQMEEDDLKTAAFWKVEWVPYVCNLESWIEYHICAFWKVESVPYIHILVYIKTHIRNKNIPVLVVSSSSLRYIIIFTKFGSHILFTS